MWGSRELFILLSVLLSSYLKGEAQRWRNLPSNISIPLKCPQQIGTNQIEARSTEVNPATWLAGTQVLDPSPTACQDAQLWEGRIKDGAGIQTQVLQSGMCVSQAASQPSTQPSLDYVWIGKEDHTLWMDCCMDLVTQHITGGWISHAVKLMMPKRRTGWSREPQDGQSLERGILVLWW